jgi:hypothetical protein
MIRNDNATIMWRRLDLPGHETARLLRTPHGWQLAGVAIFAQSQQPCRLDYKIACDERWLTRRCSISGYIGATPVKMEITRSPLNEWMNNGTALTNLENCDDIDLEFSPATNLLPIRRLELAVGASAAVSAAWIRFPDLTTEVLEQVYTRLSAERYLYESARGAFRREITVDSAGFVSEYPGLWRAEGHTAISSKSSDKR